MPGVASFSSTSTSDSLSLAPQPPAIATLVARRMGSAARRIESVTATLYPNSSTFRRGGHYPADVLASGPWNHVLAGAGAVSARSPVGRDRMRAVRRGGDRDRRRNQLGRGRDDGQ